MSYLTDIKCPVCGESIFAPCTLSGGSSGTFFNPPEAPDVDYDLTKFEYNCDCRVNIEDHAANRRVPKIKTPSKPEIRWHEINGQNTPYITWTNIEWERDELGKVVYIYHNALLKAYDDEVEYQADSSNYEYEHEDE